MRPTQILWFTFADLLQVAAIVSRLEKNAPKKDPARSQSPPPAKNPEQAPEPLRQVMGSSKGADINGDGKTINRNASMHLDAGVQGSIRGTIPSVNLTKGIGRESLDKQFEKIEVTAVRQLSTGSNASDSASPVRNGIPATISKTAEEVLADGAASEEIFGKAFRGGPQAAAGLAARLQREVNSVNHDMWLFYRFQGTDVTNLR